MRYNQNDQNLTECLVSANTFLMNGLMHSFFVVYPTHYKDGRDAEYSKFANQSEHFTIVTLANKSTSQN